jgi:hypothetical protein
VRCKGSNYCTFSTSTSRRAGSGTSDAALIFSHDQCRSTTSCSQQDKARKSWLPIPTQDGDMQQ